MKNPENHENTDGKLIEAEPAGLPAVIAEESKPEQVKISIKNIDDIYESLQNREAIFDLLKNKTIGEIEEIKRIAIELTLAKNPEYYFTYRNIELREKGVMLGAGVAAATIFGGVLLSAIGAATIPIIACFLMGTLAMGATFSAITNQPVTMIDFGKALESTIKVIALEQNAESESAKSSKKRPSKKQPSEPNTKRKPRKNKGN